MSLDMLLKKEVQMWKGEKHDKMNDPEAKGDEQFEMEMDNKVMGGSESDYSSGNSDKGDKVWRVKVTVIKIKLSRYQAVVVFELK